MCFRSSEHWAAISPPKRINEGRAFHDSYPGLLAKVVDMIDQVPMEERDTKGDLYE